MRKFADDLELAHRLADLADEISTSYFSSGSSYARKLDGSPVTKADLEVEQSIIEMLGRERPDDYVLGEEFSNHTEGALNQPTWIIDPIDHTRHFTRGNSNYGTLIALSIGDQIQIGVISAPKLEKRWAAIRNEGATLNGQPLRVSDTRSVDLAHMALAGHREWMQSNTWLDISQLLDQAEYTCGTAGGFLPAMRVADGQLDVFVEPWGEIWDHAASALIVEEAGGQATTIHGGKPLGGTLLVSNRHLHPFILPAFSNYKNMS